MHTNDSIYVAGHAGLVGSALVRSLQRQGYRNIVTRASAELDLRDGNAVQRFFAEERPRYIFVAAARVGGILENDTYPADFIHDNLRIATNLIHHAYIHKATKLLFLGSSCIYPRECPQPMKEEYFMTGPLEKTNEAYATAKIAAIKMCQAYNKQHGTNFISLMPTNLYGPNDNFDLKSAHVLPALLRKFIEAKHNEQPRVILWGTGTPRREFMHVDDLADACIFLMKTYNSGEILNVGTGTDISIRELADLIKNIVGFSGDVVRDATKPDGMPRKLLDVSKLHRLGWRHSTDLIEGIKKTTHWYLNQQSQPAAVVRQTQRA